MVLFFSVLLTSFINISEPKVYDLAMLYQTTKDVRVSYSDGRYVVEQIKFQGGGDYTGLLQYAYKLQLEGWEIYSSMDDKLLLRKLKLN